MANSHQTVASSQTVLVGNAEEPVTGFGRFKLWTSPSYTTPPGFESIEIFVDYEDDGLNPNEGIRNYDLFMILQVNNDESGINERWVNKMNHFSPYRRPNSGRLRQMLLAPEMVNVDPGVDDIQFTNTVEGRISRAQGHLGPEWRLQLVLIENDFGGAGAFQQVTFSAWAELFNA